MNKLYNYYLNIILIMAGVSALIYTAAGFDGPAITWALRIVGLFFIVDGLTLPSAYSKEGGR